MTCTFGGYSCLDPPAEAQACAEHGYPLDPWWGTANTFVCPLGQEPGRGRLLMAYGDVTALPLNGLSNLIFSDGLHNITLKNLVFVGGLAVTPDSRGNPSATYWIEVTDRRALARKVPIDKAYNVRGSNGGAYLTATQNAGVAWTWATMFADIWTAVGKLGPVPALPFTPDGTPEGYSFYGSYAYDALGHVLDRLGCALRYDPTADTFGVVRLGVADTTNAAALAAKDDADVLLWDSNPLDAGRARVPSKVRVLFPRQRQLADVTGGSPWYTVDVVDPTPGGPLPGTEVNTYQLIYDDLPAIYDGTGALTSTSVLASRAAERAADYFRRVRVGRLHRAFSGGYADRGLLPGPRVKVIRWSDRGNRLITDVTWLPGAVGPTGLSVAPTVWDYSLWNGVEVGETWPRPYLVNRILPGTGVTITPGGVGENEVLVIGSGGGGSLAALTALGTTVDAAVTTLKADAPASSETSVITWNRLSAGNIQLVVAQAGSAQTGVINATTQTIGGRKTFAGGIVVINNSRIYFGSTGAGPSLDEDVSHNLVLSLTGGSTLVWRLNSTDSTQTEIYLNDPRGINYPRVVLGNSTASRTGVSGTDATGNSYTGGFLTTLGSGIIDGGTF